MSDQGKMIFFSNETDFRPSGHGVRWKNPHE